MNPASRNIESQPAQQAGAQNKIRFAQGGDGLFPRARRRGAAARADAICNRRGKVMGAQRHGVVAQQGRCKRVVAETGIAKREI